MSAEAADPACANVVGNVFHTIFGTFDVATVLAISNGLAFLALLLAAILIALAILANTGAGMRLLIGSFLGVAVLFVISGSVAAYLQPGPPKLTELKVYPTKMPTLAGGSLQLYSEVDGVEQDIYAKAYEASLTDSKIVVAIDASPLLDWLANQKNQIVAQDNHLNNLPVSPSGPTGAGLIADGGK